MNFRSELAPKADGRPGRPIDIRVGDMLRRWACITPSARFASGTRALAAALLAALCLNLPTAAAAEVTRYLVFSGDGQPSGEQVVERGLDGQVRVRFAYKDNGRGPELEEHLQVGPDGLIASYDVRGASTMGAPVDEHFVRQGDRADWRSAADNGSATLAEPALYMPMNGSFEAVSIAIGALADRAGGRLALLPSGSLSQLQMTQVEIEAGGQRQAVQLLSLTGLGLNPVSYWATVGPRPRLFAALFPGWWSMIEQGWEAALPALTEAQQAAETRLLVDLARTTLKPMRGLGVIRNARIFDSGTARLRPGGLADVFVLRGRISAILPAGSPQLRHADQEIDAAGRVLLPGLFDMHAHIDRWDGGLHLAGGVTTVRDMGNNNAKLQTLMDETAAGDLLHPRIVPSGLLEGESPMAFRNGFVIETLQQARDAVDWYAVHGYPQLKIYNSFPRAMVREIAAYAHSRGLRVSGHVPVTMRASEAVEQGYDEIQHINQVMLEFLVTPSTDTRTLERFYLPAEKLAGLNLDSKRVTDFVALLKRRGTVIDPTLATFDFIKQRDGELAAPYAAIADHLPPDVRRSLLTGGMKIPDSETAARYRASYARMVEFVGRLYRAGVPLVAGTDAMAGFTLHSELELYVKAGLTPGQALQIATRNGARYTRTSADRGSIEVGKLADLVLVDGDPTRQISDLRRVALVLTQGRLMSPSQIYTSLGVRPFVDKEPQLRQREASRAASTLDAGQGHDSAAAVGPARHGHAH